MKEVCCLGMLLLVGCVVDFQAPKSTYVRTGVNKDRFDHRYYNYVEVGKSIPISECGAVNLSFGLQNEGDSSVINPDKGVEDYWEINYEYRW